ncbi:MAG: ABC transporter substrate-binding protein [Chloroflexi bacterium]|nr:ABC transporter substrate-binding protein [Chloroflexota bacterium]GIW09130.1 MAG: branched-chain amino acid ABC transporter substrate-binding protein [Dehalococcoidia bacterium]
MIRTLLRALSPVLIALLVASCAPSPGAPQTEAPARPATPQELAIGVNLELSGASSVWGRPQLNAIQLLADQINERGGINGAKIRLVVYDNESTPQKSLVVAKRLVEEDRVLAIIGGGSTPTTMPIVPYANEQGVTVVSIGSANDIIEPIAERKWVFKTPSNTRDIVTVMMRFLKQQGWTRVSFLSVNNAYGDAGLKEFTAAAQREGVQLVAQEKFGAEDKDMKPQLTRAAAASPQVIVVWAIPPAASLVDKNYKELGLPIPLVHDHGTSSWTYHELSEGANEGMYIVTVKGMVASQLPDNDPVKPVATAYVRSYEERYKAKAGGIDAMAYDAMLVLSKAIEKAGPNPDRAKIRDALESLQGVVGATGVFNLSPQDHNGLSDKDLVVVQIRGGNWVLIR